MTFPSIDRLLPHRAPSLLVEEILGWEADRVACRGRVPAGHPLACDGQAPMWLALEMGAQAGAVLEALRRSAERAESEPRLGYLVGIRSCTFRAAILPVDTPLEVRACRTGGAGPLALFRIEVRMPDGTVLASGQVSAYAANG